MRRGEDVHRHEHPVQHALRRVAVAGSCPRCHYDHPAVSFTAWAWSVRDAKDKPTAGQVAVLFVLGSRMDPVTGCGWTTREQLIADLGVKKETVTAATIWALDHGLIRQLVRGHNRWHGGATGSLWTLTVTDDARAVLGAVDSSFATAETGAVDTQATAETGAVDKEAGQPYKGGFERIQRRPRVPLSKTRSVRPGLTDATYGPHIEASASADEPRAGGGSDRRRALDLRAAEIHARHIQACRPPLPRSQVRQMGEYIAELIVNGGHDPGHVEQALTRWRKYRAANGRVSKRTLDSLLERIELDAAAAALQGSDDGRTAAWSAECRRCLGFHPPDQPCPKPEGII